MFHHISIAAANPFRVVKALAELTGGQYFEFPVCPGAYMVTVNDAHGTGIEVLPEHTVWAPGEIEAEPRSIESLPQFYPIHAALSVGVSRETIETIGSREGWLVRW